jgi:chromosome segregation ATPase
MSSTDDRKLPDGEITLNGVRYLATAAVTKIVAQWDAAEARIVALKAERDELAYALATWKQLTAEAEARATAAERERDDLKRRLEEAASSARHWERMYREEYDRGHSEPTGMTQ